MGLVDLKKENQVKKEGPALKRFKIMMRDYGKNGAAFLRGPSSGTFGNTKVLQSFMSTCVP